MEKLRTTLRDLFETQAAQVLLVDELIACFQREEESAAGFSQSVLNEVIGLKDQLVHRFASLEEKRVAGVNQLAFLIGFDLRGSSPSLSVMVAALRAYSENLRGLLAADELAAVQKAISVYCDSSLQQLPDYERLAERVRRNRLIVRRVLASVNRSMRFFEHVFQVSDVSYDEGGKSRSRLGGSPQATQVSIRA